MATTTPHDDSAKRAVDASCEIIIDALYMTSDVLHSITNRLPVDMEHAQVVLKKEKPIGAHELASNDDVVPAPRRRLARFALVAVGVAAMTLGAIEIASAIGTTDAPAPRSERTVVLPTPLEEARAHLESGDALSALSAVELADAQGLDSTELRQTHVESLMQLDRWADARDVALQAVADGYGTEFVSHYRTALHADPTFDAATPLTTDEVTKVGNEGNALVVERGGIAYRLDVARVDDSTWASQVSSARLCAALGCAFDMPRVEHRLVDRDMARALGLELESLAWRATAVGEVADVALTEQMKVKTRFPVEYTRTWRNLLSAEVDESYLDAPFVATIEPLAGEGEWARRVIAERGAVGSREFARQMGDLIAFDFLTNNYGRFERRAERYGTHTRWLSGKLVSPDHSDAFASRQSRRVRDRFHWMTRMPATTATAVRLMAPEFVDEHVLVGLDATQREVFWAQQAAFAERLDKLEVERGRSRTLAL